MDHGTHPQTSHTDVTILVDASDPVGLHNDFLLGLGPNDGLVGSGEISLLGTEAMVIIYIVVGVIFVSLSLLVTVFIVCRRVRSRQERQQRQWRCRQRQRRFQADGSKVNGFVEVNENTKESFQQSSSEYKPPGKSTNASYIGWKKMLLDYDCADCNKDEGESSKTRESGRGKYHRLPPHFTESSCYTIRMTSVPRHRPVAGDLTATTSAAPTAFAYLIPSTSTSANASDAPGNGGDFYLIPHSPGFSSEPPVVGQTVSTCINQLVGCPGTLGKVHGQAELITLPISTDALVRTEIWTNDPKSSEPYVTLKPYCQLDACFQNAHFVDPGIPPNEGSNNLTDSPSAKCLLLQNRQHCSATDSSTPPATPSISIVDPLTGNRIFVPPFTGNAGGFILPASNNSGSSPRIIAVPPEPSARADSMESDPGDLKKISSANQGSSEKEVST
ncbi:hypothetical protein Aperf_G00000090835 [Anoplocephala perfoliata]